MDVLLDVRDLETDTVEPEESCGGDVEDMIAGTGLVFSVKSCLSQDLSTNLYKVKYGNIFFLVHSFFTLCDKNPF